MFHNSVTEHYRNTKAPEELRERVMTSVAAVRRQRSPLSLPALTAVAAALVLLVVGTLQWINPASITLSVNGTPFTGDTLVLAADDDPAVARASLAQTVELVFTSDDEITVRTEDEGWFLRERGQDTPLTPHTDHTVDGSVTVTCTIGTNPKYLLVGERRFCVRYSEEQQAALVEEL